MEKTKDLIRIAKELNNLYLSKKQALPYSINIIRELHATENANSRILRGLLQYSPDGQYPILHSFIELMELVADCVIDISIMAPELSNEEGRMGTPHSPRIRKEVSNLAVRDFLVSQPTPHRPSVAVLSLVY